MRPTLLILLLAGIPLFGADAQKAPSDQYEKTPKPAVTRKIIGTGMFLTEFIGLPLLEATFSWEHSLRLQNPFKYIKETEPYIQDELWHFVAASTFTELNYGILKNYFGAKKPILAAGIISMVSWTMLECLDGMAGSGFSLRDQAGHTLGAGFGMLSLAYPDMPLHMRVGVKSWPSLFEAFGDAISSGNYSESLADRYSFMKVELIYLHESSLYGGLAVSTTEETEHNIFGITAGFDFVKWLNKRSQGWWNAPLDFVSNHFVTSLTLTWWFE
ncbi:MAG: hypothetical protein ACOC41_07305 [Chitinivibrionales bacterium]